VKKSLILLSSIASIVFLGCSSKTVNIKAQLPAEVDSLTKKRSLAVIPFKGDNINFTGRLESKLANVRINGRPYFRVINRDKIGDVLKELKFQSSDLVGKKAARFGKLAGAQVLITGNVKTTATNGSYRKPEERCSSYDKKGRCLGYTTVYVTCRTSNATLNATINAIDVNTAQVIDAVNISKNYQSDSCDGYNYMRAERALSGLADQAATEYVNRVAPHYVILQVELIDDVDSVDLTSKQEKLFDNALKYIEDGRLDRAEYLLKKLNEETGEKSYEILYDLGVVEEALGKLNEAKAAYEMADKVILDTGEEPNKLVNKAIERINKLIEDQNKLKEQLK